MADEDTDDTPLTEPVTVNCLYLTGAAIEVTRHVARTVGWVALPDQTGGEAKERRVAVRFAMPIDAARAYWRDLGDELRGKAR